MQDTAHIVYIFNIYIKLSKLFTLNNWTIWTMVTIRPMRRSEIKHFAILIHTIKIYLIKWTTRVCLFDRKIRREINQRLYFPKYSHLAKRYF